MGCVPVLATARDLFPLAYSWLTGLQSLRPAAARALTGRPAVAVYAKKLQHSDPSVATVWALLRLFAGELHAVTNQKLNNMLKEIGRFADLGAPIERMRYWAGQRQMKTFKKHERLSCHTAQRTFVTLSLEARIRPEVVMRVSGHRTWAAFRCYVAISEQVVEQ